MASSKKAAKSTKTGVGTLSLTRFLIAGSVAANIGFTVVFLTMATTNALDTTLIDNGLQRYCEAQNDKRFADAPQQSKALRDYTCARGDAKEYFEKGLDEYLDYKKQQNVSE